MPIQLPRWLGADVPPGISAFVNNFAGTLERIFNGGAQLGANAAPNGPAGGDLAGYYPKPALLRTKSATSVSSATGTTLSAAALSGGIILRSGPNSAFTDTTDTAAHLLAQFASAAQAIGASADCLVINEASSTMAIAAGGGVSLAGNTSGGNFIVAAATTRLFRFIVTAIGTPAVTLYG